MLLEKIRNKSVNIILLTPTNKTAVGVYFYNSMQEMGYKVNMVDFRKHPDWYERFNLDETDLFILFKGYNDAKNNRQLITHIKKLGKPCILFYPDDMHTYDLCRVLSKNLNYTFHFNPEIVEKLKEDNCCKNVSTLRFGYDKKYFYPRIKDKEYDIIFIGNIYGKRKELLEKLGKHFTVKVGNLENDRMAEEISKAKLVFNHCVGNGLNMRVFETMACECAMLLNKQASKEMKKINAYPDIHYIEYDSINLIDVVKKYLDGDKKVLDFIGKNARIRVEEMTYDNIVQKMFSKIICELEIRDLKYDSFILKDEEKKRIGFVTTWFNRGLSYVAKNILNVLKEENEFETFVYAKFGVDPSNKEKLIISKQKDWRLKNVTLSTDCNAQQWAEWNKLDVVVFLENFNDWDILTRFKLMNIKTVLIPMCEYITSETIMASRTYLIDKILSFTKFGKDILEKGKVNNNKISYIKYAISNKYGSDIKRETKKRRILFNLGWDYTGRKNRDKVIRSLIKYKNKHNDIEIIIKTQNKNIIYNYKDNDIIFINADSTEKEMHELYSTIDVIVTPSKWEGLCLNLYEAMAYGIPVVTSDIPPMNEIDSNCGCFVKGGFYKNKKINFIPIFEFEEDDFYNKLDEALKEKVFNKKKIKNKNDINYADFKINIYNFFKELFYSKILLPNITNKNGKIRIAHFARYSPHLSGMYETVREMVQAENNYGFDAGFIDTFRFGKDGDKDRGVTTVAPAFANDADILILHTIIPQPFLDKNKNLLMLLHGRPDHCFHGEISGGEKTYTTIINYFESNYFKGYITLWERHIEFWKAITNRPVYYVPPFVDLDFFKPEGKKYKFKYPGEPNVVFGDPWRLDANPYHLMHAFILFKKKYPKAKLHLFCKKRKDKEIWKKLIVGMVKTGNDIFGDIEASVNNMDEIYRAADFLITTQVDAVRMVREPLACGCPIVTPVGNRFALHTANFLFPKNLCQTMVNIWEDIKNRNEDIRSYSRGVANLEFNIKDSMKKLDEIAKEVCHENSKTSSQIF